MKPTFGLNPVGVVENMFGDGIAKVEMYDFSRANMDSKSRLHAITSVASICYQNPKAIDSQSLYDRLAAESKGLPSSSYEVVPVLIPDNIYADRVSKNIHTLYNPLTKFGIWVKEMGQDYLLTNFRAIIALHETTGIDLRDFYNTKKECEIISRWHVIFRVKIDTNTRAQLVRHRVANYQELSRRYVAEKKVPFTFYVSKKLKDLTSRYIHTTEGNKTQALDFTTEDINNICLNHYRIALENGVKPQEARRIIPQSMYTDIWVSFDRMHFGSFLKLRLDKSAQFEIRAMATAMQYLSSIPYKEVLVNNIDVTKENLVKIKEETEKLKTNVSDDSAAGKLNKEYLVEAESYIKALEQMLKEHEDMLVNIETIMSSQGYLVE